MIVARLLMRLGSSRGHEIEIRKEIKKHSRRKQIEEGGLAGVEVDSRRVYWNKAANMRMGKQRERQTCA